MELQEIDWAFRAAEQAGDLEGCAACQVQMFDLLEAHPEIEDTPEFGYQHIRGMVLVAAAAMAFDSGEERRAEYYLRHFPARLLERGCFFPEYRHALGVLAYRRGSFAEAQELLEAHLARYPQDETAWMYLGNAHFHMEAFQQAADAYRKALFQKAEFEEASENLTVAVSQMMSSRGDGTSSLREQEGSLGISYGDWDAVRRLPIFINCRDRVGCLSRLVSRLLASGYRNLVLLDNASTYPPLLAFYERIRSPQVRVVKLGQNFGHRALWDSGILELLHIRTPYVYTDPDVLPGEGCPPRFLQKFVRVLSEHPSVSKVGAALRYDDITFFDRERKQASESVFYIAPIAEHVYFANVDTTFALYRNVRFYHRGPALRMAGPYMFRHLPWYYDYAHLPEDEQYYLDHVEKSSSMKADFISASRGMKEAQ